MAGVTLARDAGFRAKAALACPGHDQLTLELGQAAEHSKHQPAMGRRGIGPSILEALEAGAAIADGSQNVEQIARRPSQPIQPRHQQHVARLKPTDHLGQLGPVRLGAADLLLEDLGTAGGHQLGILSNQVLITGADATDRTARMVPIGAGARMRPVHDLSGR
jgi:hypothetical protein